MTVLRERIADSLPPGVCLIAKPARLDFLHSASARVRPELTAFAAYCEMTRNVSTPLRLAFRLRDKIWRLFKVEEIYGFTGDRSAAAPNAGSKLDFFTVESVSDDQLVLTSKDKHLAVMVSLDILSRAENAEVPGPSKSLHVTASVETYNAFGRA